MDKKPLALLLICLIVLFTSFLYSVFNPTQNFFSSLPLTIIVLIAFIFGILFFGLISFVPHIFLGLSLGAQKNAVIFIYFFPVMIATYAGVKLGSALIDDFNKKSYFLGKGKSVLILLIVAIVIAIAIEYALPLISTLDLWPKDLFGLSIEKQETVFAALEKLRELI